VSSGQPNGVGGPKTINYVVYFWFTTIQIAAASSSSAHYHGRICSAFSDCGGNCGLRRRPRMVRSGPARSKYPRWVLRFGVLNCILRGHRLGLLNACNVAWHRFGMASSACLGAACYAGGSHSELAPLKSVAADGLGCASLWLLTWSLPGCEDLFQTGKSAHIGSLMNGHVKTWPWNLRDTISLALGIPACAI
jgi:hypothetical protein